MKVQTNIKDRVTANHNQTLVQPAAPVRIANHNQTVVIPVPMRVANHNQTMVRSSR